MTQKSTETGARPKADAVPGGQAEKPTEIPPKGWLEVVKRGWAEAKADQVPLLGSAASAFRPGVTLDQQCSWPIQIVYFVRVLENFNLRKR